MRKFYMIIARKTIKIPEFLWHLLEKLTKFQNFTRFVPPNAPILHNNCPKICFPDLEEGGTAPLPLPRLRRLCCQITITFA